MKKDSTRTGATLCSSMRPRSATTSWSNKFKLLAFAFMALLSINAWGTVAPVNTVLWGETWTGATTGTSGNDKYTPSANYGKGTTVYNSGSVSYSQSANTVYVRNENTGGGTAPELLLSNGKTWTISSISTCGAVELSLTYVSNNTKSSVTCSTSGVSISGSSKSYTIKSSTNGAALPETITLVFGCSGNTRIDNVVLKVTEAGASTYTVDFDANGGSVTQSRATQASAGASISLPTPTRDCYRCTGWYTAASGGTKRGDAGGSYVPTASETIYAQWTSSKLATPTNSRSTNITQTEATLSWNAVTNASSYDVFVTDGDAEYSYNVSSTSKTVTGLTAGTYYMWTVKAKGTGVYCVSDEAEGGFTTEAAPSTPDYYYRGEDNDWGATKMTASEDGLFCYIQSSNNSNQFKIAKTTTGYDYNYLRVQKGYNNTDVQSIGDYGQDNCYCWQSGTYYILVYYPNTIINSTNEPVICAASELPYNAYSNKTIYFDNTLYGNTTPYLRIGRNNHSLNTAMTKVSGTANLYKLTTTGSDFFYQTFYAYTVANAQGSSSNIYDLGSVTKTTVHAKKDINKDITIVPTGGETYYNYNESDGMLTHNVSIGSHTNGTIKYSYTDVNGTAHNDQTSGASNLAHTCNLTITATPNTGYQLTSLTVNGNAFTSGSVHILSADATIAATFSVASYNVTLNTNGGTIKSGNVTSYTYGVGATLPTQVEKSGYTFGGWFDNSDCTGTAVTKIANNATGDKQFWAKWIQNVTVTFKNNGETTGAPAAIQLAPGSTLGSNLPGVGSMTAPIAGYTFVGWVNHSDVWSGFEANLTQTLITGNEVINADVTYDAVWAKAYNDYGRVIDGEEITTGKYLFTSNGDYALDNNFTTGTTAGKSITDEDGWVYGITDATILWVITAKDGTYSFYNAAKGKYLNTVSNSADLTLQDSPAWFTLTRTKDDYNNSLFDFACNGRHLEYWSSKFDTDGSKMYGTIMLYKQDATNFFVTPPDQITVTWHIGNGTQTATTYDGTAFSELTAPSVADDAIGDCVDKFMGWATAAITKDEAEESDVQWANETTISNSNKEFYAVFAQGNDGGTGSVVLSYTSLGLTTSYESGSTKIVSDIDFYCYNVMTGSSGQDGYQKIQFRRSKDGSGYIYNSEAMPGNITSIVLSNTTRNMTVYFGTSANPDSNEKICTSSSLTAVPSGNYTYFKIVNAEDGAAYIETITINYSSASYSNYATSCPDLKYATIHFDANGKTLASGSMPADITNAIVGKANTLPSCSATVTGYTFAGWSESTTGSVITQYTPAAEGQTYTLYAIWTPKTVTITWNANGGSVTPASSSYTYDGASVELPTPTTTQEKKFVGWFTAATGGTQITEIGTTNKPDANVTYYAQWRDITWTDYLTDCGTSYNITLADGGTKTGGNTFSTSPAGTAMGGSEVTLTANPNSCYTFTSWDVYKTGDQSTKVTVDGNSFEMPEYDVTVDATFTQIDYVISYDLQGGAAPQGSSETYGNVNVGCGNTWTAPVDPVKAGYTFQGWLGAESATLYKQGQGFTPTQTQTMVAQWTANPYVWTLYNNQSGEWTDAAIADVTSGSVVFNFTEKEQQFAFKIRKTNDGGESHTYYGANEGNEYTYAISTGDTKNWTLDGSHNVNVTTAAKGTYTIHISMDGDNPRIYIEYPTPYTIHFDGKGADDGSMADIVNIASGENVVLPANGFTKTNNAFVGWDTNSAGTNVVYGDQATINNVSADITLYAVWVSARYTITLDANGGEVSPDRVQQAVVGGTVALPTPTRDGYAFDGWYTEREGGSKITEAYPIPLADATYYAHWTSLETSWYVKGDFDWTNGVQFVKLPGETGSIAYATVELSSNTQFKLYNSSTGKWYSYNNEASKITQDNCTNWTLYEDNNNSEITISGNGRYTFKLDYSGTNPVISVAYPNWYISIYNKSAGSESGHFTYLNPTEWIYANFTVPTPTADKNLWVSDRDSWSNTHSAEWPYRWIMLKQYVSEKIGHGVDGAVGTLYINPFSTGSQDNYGLRFDPAGYGMKYGSGSGAGDMTDGYLAFTQKTNDPAVWNTQAIENIEGYKGKQFYVGLATATEGDYKFSYDYGQDCNGLSAIANINDIKVWTEANPDRWGDATVGSLSNTRGHFQIWADNASQKNFYIHWIPDNKMTFDLGDAEGHVAAIDPMYRGRDLSGSEATITLPEPEDWISHTFDGWVINGVQHNAGDEILLNEDMTAVAQWTTNYYTITYAGISAYSTTCDGSTSVLCGTAQTVCTPTEATGYEFSGWTSDVSLDGKTEFVGGENFTMPCENVTFTGSYTPITYDITYAGLEGASNPNPTSYTIETPTITLQDPGARVGYTFTGWTENGVTIIGITAGTTGNKTITANWSLNSHNVIFDANGHGTAPAGYIGISYGATITEPTAPADVEEGGNVYTFIGWYKEAGCTNVWNFATDVMPDADLTLYAKWSGVTYEDYRTHCCTPLDAPTGGVANNITMTTATLSWNAVTDNNGYQVSADQASWVDVLSGESYNLTGLTAGTHYIYYVRAIGDNDEHCQYGTAAQIEFTTKAALHITYNANGGTGADVVSEDIEEGTSATVAGNTFTAPTGMTFNGWNTATDGTGTAYAVGATINPLNADLTLYAQWIGATFNVTYDLNGGTGDCESTTATYNSTFTICSAIPTKGTNAFTGWLRSDNSEIYQAGGTFAMPASDVTLTAQWAASYTVTYVINNVVVSGPNPAGNVYVAQGQPTTLPDFEFSCGLYDQFIGWVDAAVAEQDEKIPCPALVGKPGDSFTPIGNITLYALFGHDAENLGWVKQTTISSGKYLMSDGTRVMTGFNNESTTTNFLAATTAADDGNGQYATKPTDAAELEVSVLGNGQFTMMLLSNNQYLAATNDAFLNPSSTATNACKWELMDGSTQPTTDLGMMPQGSIHSVEYTSRGLLGNTSQVRFTCYDKIASKSVPYLYKLINEGYYTTSPTCEIPTSVTVTYNKNTEDEVTMCENVELAFDATSGYPTLAEPYTLCAAANVDREGYVLRTWNTAANGSGKNYAPDTVFTELGNNLNLYAQWDRVYTVTFHDKYGSAEATTNPVTQASLGSTINVPAAALDDECITFVGWTSESTVQSGNPVQPNIVIAAGTATYTPTEDMHLYAIYSKEGSALDFAPATEGVRSFYLANTALTSYATGTISATSTGGKFSSEAATTNATPIFIDYQTSHVSNYKYTIRTANGYLAPATGSTKTNFMSQAEPYYWNIVSGSDGGYNIKESTSLDRQISYSDPSFGFYQSPTSVKLVPCAASTFWSNPTCAEFVTITFQTVGDITIDWTGSKGSAEDYKDLPINTSVTQWPTAQYEGWTFAGWSKVDYSNSSKYAGSFAEDTKNGTIQPDQSDGLYANEKATLELIANNNYNMYPIFTKVHESTEFDEAIGGDYLIYFKGDGARYKDDYTKFDNENLRVYATDYSGSAYHSTSSCAEAYTFTFVKRADGNWNIKRGDKYLCNTNDNDIAEQAGLPDYGWTMEKQSNGSYIIHYVGNSDIRKYIRVLDLGSGAITNNTFKCYSEDQAGSGMYMPVFIGSCVERQYSSEPSNKPTLEMAGAVYTTSANGQDVRSATGYTIKGSFLKANTEIRLTDASGNAIAGLSIVGSDGKVIKADANGTLASTTAYVVYNPTETTDGITNMKVYISAVDRNDAAIRSAAPSINNIHLRHLPAKFLIAQKVGSDWYALPNDMNASMTNPAAAKLLSVNEATGTATIYSDVENIYAYTLLAGKASTANMVFNSQATGKTGSALRSSTTESETTMGLYATGSWYSTTPEYEFAPATEDLKDYTLTSAKQNADLGIADGNWVISGDQTVRFFAIDQQPAVNLTLTGDVALTSANNIEVYGNQTSNLLHIRANYTNVAKLRYTYNDGTSDVAVSSSVFRLNYYDFASQTNYNKADATTANHRIDVSSLTGEVDQTFSVSLTPTAANTMYNYTLTIAALDASDNVMEEKQITLKGRSLPEQFVIAMKSTNGDSWYALPNDLATSTSEGSSTKAPIMISVDNTTAPTKALMAPKNTLYKGDGRYEATKHRNAIRFLRADAEDKAWITTTSTSQLYMPAENSDKQQFNLLSSDLAKYTITQDEATRTIAMYGGIIGWYGSGSNETVYLLPVDASAEPAVFDVVEWFPTKLLIESSQVITTTSVQVGTDDAVVGTAGTTTYGTNLYEVQTGDLTAKAGQAMSVSYTIEATTYAKVVTVPIILSRGKYATSGSDVFGGLDAQSKYQYNDLVVRDGATLTVDAATGTWNKFVNVTIYPTSKVIVPAQSSDAKDITMTTTTMTLFGGTDEIYNGSEYTLTKYGVPQLVLNGKLVHNETTSGLVYDVRLDAVQYYNFALPYTSKYELVTDNKGGEDFTFWTKIYNGEARAAGGTGWDWYNWNADPWAINIGTGYMFAAQPYAGQNYIIIRHPMGYDATENADGHRTSTAEATKAAVDVYAYPSKYDNNAGWNYIANPFMANFTKDLGEGATGIIQTGQLVKHKVNEKWDGHYEWKAGSLSVRYVTLYDNGTDTYEQLPMSTAVLPPFTGFFVQMAENGTIVFDISGRTNSAPARILSEDELPSEMEIFLHATCQGQKDDAVLFINDELHRDNAKEFPNEMTKQENANTLNFYTFGGDDIKMYANGMSYEDAQGWSKAGVKVATAGEYTFSVASDQADYIQQVILRDMDSNTEYDLMSNDAKIYLDKGEMNDRFYVKIVFGKHNIGTGVMDGHDTRGPEKFILNDHMYIRANGVLYDGVGKRVKY